MTGRRFDEKCCVKRCAACPRAATRRPLCRSFREQQRRNCGRRNTGRASGRCRRAIYLARKGLGRRALHHRLSAGMTCKPGPVTHPSWAAAFVCDAAIPCLRARRTRRRGSRIGFGEAVHPGVSRARAVTRSGACRHTSQRPPDRPWNDLPLRTARCRRQYLAAMPAIEGEPREGHDTGVGDRGQTAGYVGQMVSSHKRPTIGKLAASILYRTRRCRKGGALGNRYSPGGARCVPLLPGGREFLSQWLAQFFASRQDFRTYG